jgi:Fe-S-cluster-containing hydrogenase component 2
MTFASAWLIHNGLQTGRANEMSVGEISRIRLRLRDDRALLHEEGACLPLRSRYGGCRACADACPVGALQVSVDAVMLGAACFGCGRCTAACPTQALTLPDLGALDDAPAAMRPSSTLRIECRKVPAHQRASGTLTVACLGALTSGHLLACRAAGIRVEVVDRGWCQGCEAGGAPANAACGTGGHAAGEAIQAANVWLEALGAPDGPALVFEPLPAAERPTAIPPPDTPMESRIDRRAFFREVVDRPAGRGRTAATPMGGDGRAAYPADRRQPSPERVRQLAAIAAIATAQGAPVPAELYPTLEVDSRCCDQRLCVALCPTAALAVRDGPGSARLEWDAGRCIACGTCVRGCPEGAMHLAAHGGSPGVRVVAEHARATCHGCGDAFTPAAGTADGDPALCPSCTKSRRFVDDARRQLFRT